MKHILYQLRWFFIPYLILLGICLIIKLTYTREEIYYAVNSMYSNWADAAAPYITNVGSGWTVVVLTLIMLLFNYRNAFYLLLRILLPPLLHKHLNTILTLRDHNYILKISSTASTLCLEPSS